MSETALDVKIFETSNDPSETVLIVNGMENISIDRFSRILYFKL